MGSSKQKRRAAASGADNLKSGPKININKVEKLGSTSKKPRTIAAEKKATEKQINFLKRTSNLLKEEIKTMEERMTRTAQLYDNGANPQYKEELDSLKDTIEESKGTLRSYNADMEEHVERLRGYESMDISEAQETEASATQATSRNEVPANSDESPKDQESQPYVAPPADTPLPSIEVPDDDEAWSYTPAKHRAATGRSDDEKVVAWREVGYSKQIVVSYGPKNSAKYVRTTCAKSGLAIDKTTAVEIGPGTRLGDKTRGEKKNKEYVHHIDQFGGIAGVALDEGVSVEDLKPRETPKKGEKGEKGKRYPISEIYTWWTVAEKKVWVWETRSSLRHVLGGAAACASWIYGAAKEHERRHELWKLNLREGKDSSPSPVPGFKGGLAPPSPPTGPVPKPKSAVPAASDGDLSYGPYDNEEQFNEGIVKALESSRQGSYVDHVCEMVRTFKNHEIVLTHGDFAPRNILVQGTKVVAVLDWEMAGFYPEYWEYVKALWRPDWQSRWVKEKVTDQILKPYLTELAVVWHTREITW